MPGKTTVWKVLFRTKARSNKQPFCVVMKMPGLFVGPGIFNGAGQIDGFFSYSGRFCPLPMTAY